MSAQLPDALAGQPLPAVLLPYQQEAVRAIATHPVVVWEKSRRIGATWGIGAAAVLTAGAARSAGGMDVLYIGYSEDMTREFIDACAMWARAISPAAAAVEETLFATDARDIKAFRIVFASGYEILALSSRPRNLRGKQGLVILDEAAFHDDLTGLLAAATPLLIWGGRVLVLSSHNGEASAFNQLVTDIRAGRVPYHLMTTTFADALKDGLYRRISLVTGRPWAEAAEFAWEAEIRAQQRDPAQELDCIPASSSGTVLAGTLIEARQDGAIPVLRFQGPPGMAEQPASDREAAVRAWWEATVSPALMAAPQDSPTWVGVDFGRQTDLTVIWPVQMGRDMRRRPPCVIELRTVPWEQQRQILWWTLDALPRLSGGALDAAGIGAVLAEETAQRYGLTLWTRVGIDQGWQAWYRDHMPRLIAAFEDDMTRIPRDRDIYDDHRALQRVNGIIQPPPVRTSTVSGERHADAAIAHALAFVASALVGVPIGYRAAGHERPACAPWPWAGNGWLMRGPATLLTMARPTAGWTPWR